MSRVRRSLAVLLLLLAAGLPLGLPVQADPDESTPEDDSVLLDLVGALHEHSGYSDGWPGSTPAHVFASGRANGLDFLGSGDHSDTFGVPVTANDECLDPVVLATGCTDPHPGDRIAGAEKWEATGRQAAEATDASFVAFRGFESTDDRHNHLNVYFSRNVFNAKAQGGYAHEDVFWRWFTTRPELGGGGDGLGTFNHPGAKDLADGDHARDWADFRHIPEADDRMVGIEVYNDDDDYGSAGPPEGWYVHALDKGWHLGAIGAEDLGHRRGDNWGGSEWAKTVVMATARTPEAIRSALLARRFYAVRYGDIRLDFRVAGRRMGERLTRPAGRTLPVRASVSRPDLTLELVTSGGQVLARTGAGEDLHTQVTTDPAQRYYFVRARDAAGRVLAYGTPVWVSASRPAPVGEWLAGDFHVHTCASHDAYCGPDDHNTDTTEFWTLSGNVDERFLEARANGLDFLAITDHHSDRHPEESGALSWREPGFGGHGVIGVRGYENSVSGHAQMLGAGRVYPAGDQSAPAVRAMADALRADGGVFQANHPGGPRSFGACDDTAGMHWRYGYDVRPDTIEVWNGPHALHPPVPSAGSNVEPLRYWECWLQRGERVTATGGSDSHWLHSGFANGPGHPTTWVFATERSERGVLDALRAGRTSIAFRAPANGALLLLLDGDRDRDGVYEAMVGDDVPAGTPLRLRALGLPGAGLVDVRANGAPLLTAQTLQPGGELRFTAPDAPGWVRATLFLPEGLEARQTACDPAVGEHTTYCREGVAAAAMTSPIYLR